MAFFPHTVSEDNITVLIAGSMNKIPKSHAGFAALAKHLRTEEHDADLILTLLDKRQAIARLTAGKVKVVGNTVYYNGSPTPRDTLSMKMVEMLENGFSAKPLAQFLDNVMLNPDERSREHVYDFIERWNAPLTEDGCFIAFKGVRENYTDVYTGNFDNSPGKVVEQDRAICDPDPSRTCSSGLHVCASYYLDTFWGNQKVIAVKVNPRDVVAVPTDYKYSKMRVCRYEVLGDIEDERHRDSVEASSVVTVSNDRVGEQKGDYAGTDEGDWEAEYECESESCGDVVDYEGEICFDCEAHQKRDEDEEQKRLDAENEEVDEPEELLFEHKTSGRAFSEKVLMREVRNLGQRGFQKAYGVPRTTVQEWLKAIKNK